MTTERGQTLVIGAKTKLVGLLASPSGHSRSPMLHNRAFEQLGLDYVYLAFDVNEQRLEAAVQGMRALGAAGFNLSMPNKVSVIPYLDVLSPEVKQIGSVNTVVNEDGRLVGYNTDGKGFLKSLEEQGISVCGKKVTVVGFGGAGRAVSVACLYGGAEVSVLYREGPSMHSAQRLKQRLNGDFARRLHFFDIADRAIGEEVIGQSEIYVNATPLGMGVYADRSPIEDRKWLRPQMIVCDLIYDPKQTKLLRMAQEAGCRTFNGERMLFHQAAEAFFLWTGQQMPDLAIGGIK